MQITTADDLRARLEGVATITPAGVEVTDEGRLRGELIDELVFEAVFNAGRGPARCRALGDLERIAGPWLRLGLDP